MLKTYIQERRHGCLPPPLDQLRYYADFTTDQYTFFPFLQVTTQLQDSDMGLLVPDTTDSRKIPKPLCSWPPPPFSLY
jgi:hypothetical protein